MNSVKTGILGCGRIAPAYLKNLTGALSGWVEVVACADLVPELASRLAADFKLRRACHPDELLADPSIELIVNLTPAPNHHAVSLSILHAGKHLFTEKPLALTIEHARELVEVAASKGLSLAGAADTFLGSSLQHARGLLDQGRIGTPIAASAFVSINAFNRERYHSVYRGALLDLGPYYLTALISLLGPVATVSAAGPIRFPRKEGPEGVEFAVDFPSTVSASLEFCAGPVASLIASCDVHDYLPRVEIFGTEATLLPADANQYGGVVAVTTRLSEQRYDKTDGFSQPGRGLGVAEQALAIREGRAPRAGADLLLHVTEVMLAVHQAASSGRQVVIRSACSRPAPFDASSLRLS